MTIFWHKSIPSQVDFRGLKKQYMSPLRQGDLFNSPSAKCITGFSPNIIKMKMSCHREGRLGGVDLGLELGEPDRSCIHFNAHYCQTAPPASGREPTERRDGRTRTFSRSFSRKRQSRACQTEGHGRTESHKCVSASQQRFNTAKVLN